MESIEVFSIEKHHSTEKREQKSKNIEGRRNIEKKMRAGIQMVENESLRWSNNLSDGTNSEDILRVDLWRKQGHLYLT